MNNKYSNVFYLNGDGTTEIETLAHYRTQGTNKPAWIHIDLNKREGKRWLSKESKIDPITVKAMSMVESRPRCTASAGGILIILRGINLNPGQDPEDMISIRIWIEKQRIITAGRRHLHSVDELQKSFTEGQGPKDVNHVLIVLNELLTDHIMNEISKVDDLLDALEEAVLSKEDRKLRVNLLEIRQRAIELRRYLSPQKEALSKLLSINTPLLNEHEKSHIRESNERLMRYIENLDAMRDRSAIVQEELQSRISERIESRMYALSIASLIFLPLSFFTGLLGINVGGIPGTESPIAFAVVCGGLLFMAIGLLAWLRYKDWI